MSLRTATAEKQRQEWRRTGSRRGDRRDPIWCGIGSVSVSNMQGSENKVDRKWSVMGLEASATQVCGSSSTKISISCVPSRTKQPVVPCTGHKPTCQLTLVVSGRWEMLGHSPSNRTALEPGCARQACRMPWSRGGGLSLSPTATCCLLASAKTSLRSRTPAKTLQHNATPSYKA